MLLTLANTENVCAGYNTKKSRVRDMAIQLGYIYSHVENLPVTHVTHVTI